MSTPPAAAPVLKRQLTAEARASLIQMLMFDTHAGYEKMGHAVPSAHALTAETKAKADSAAAAAAAAAAASAAAATASSSADAESKGDAGIADASTPDDAGGAATAAVSPSPRPPPYTGQWVVSEKIHGANVSDRKGPPDTVTLRAPMHRKYKYMMETYITLSNRKRPSHCAKAWVHS